MMEAMKNVHRINARRRILHENITAYLFLLPSFLIIGIFLIIPILMLFVLSVRSYNFSGLSDTFVGLENFKNLFGDEEFLKSLKATYQFAIITVPLQMVIALFVANAVNKKLRGVSIYSTIFFIPVVVSFVVVAILWKFLFNSDFGLINAIIDTLGFPKQSFLGNAKIAIYSMVITFVWKSWGFYMLIFLAGLKGIPDDIYESAAIDGATGRQRFFYVTVPMLKRTTLFVLVMSSMNVIVKVFPVIFNMTDGGPRGSTNMLVYFVWMKAFRIGEVSYASAASIILFIFVMLVTVVQLKLGDKD